MNPQDIENLAQLARMDLSEDEKASLVGDMEKILGYQIMALCKEGGF